MFNVAICGETLVERFTCNTILFEVVSCPETVWCGTLGYAPNCTDEPDIGALLQKYQNLCGIPKRGIANPDWSCAVSIDYWQEGAAPRGMMFAQQALTREQDPAHDVYVMPESLFVRVANTAEAARAAFGRESCEVYELFGVIKDCPAVNGYAVATNGAQEIELYNHGAGLAYAYVQAIRLP